MEDTMKTQTLGKRLALSRERQLADNLAPAPAWTQLPEREVARARRAVEWLFESAAKRLGQLIRQEGGKVKIFLAANSAAPARAEAALRSLEASSRPLHWTLAIELSAHPFHQEWAHFKQWARDQELFVDVCAELDPVFDRTLHVVRAWPLT
jgi:hypothetical protein